MAANGHDRSCWICAICVDLRSFPFRTATKTEAPTQSITQQGHTKNLRNLRNLRINAVSLSMKHSWL
ncbi:hypothetical protein T5B8_04423 [Salinisphaera sp. T5B8]